jgi:hypothetical protein
MNFVKPNEAETLQILNNAIRTPDGLNPEVVHEFSYRDYMVQQPTPNHLIDNTEVVVGSQFRNLIVADLPDDFEVEIRGMRFNKNNLWIYIIHL